jgi:hypothetical protein
MLECGNIIVLVEETSRSKLEDLEKIDNTIEWLHLYSIGLKLDGNL